VKAGWEVKTLSEITTKIGSGATPRGGQAAYKTKGVSLIRSLNVHDLWFKEKNLAFIDDEQAEALSNVVVQSGDVLLNITGASIARCCTAPDNKLPARVNQHVSILRPDPKAVSSKYLSYMLTSKEQKDKLLGIGDDAGSTRQALTKSHLQSYAIPLPPLEEQKRIVAVLDAAFEGLTRARAHVETNLQSARELFAQGVEAVFDRLDPKSIKSKRLGSIVSRLTNGYVGPTRNIYFDEGIPYLLARHVKNNRLRFDERTFISAEFNEKIKKSKLMAGDVLLVQSGHIGHCAVVPEEHEGHNCHAMIVLSAIPEILTGQYLSAVLNTPTLQDHFQKIRTGSTVPHLTCKLVKEMMLPIPDIGLQDEVVAKIDLLRSQVDETETHYRTKLQDLDDLRQSFLQKAFAGELT
tara:strand:+ start:799 stop:2022 length:1224 start_codon:yes stop_codon:yes gene_type:complete